MSEPMIPGTFSVSAGAAARAKAAVDPNLNPPKGARVTPDKNDPSKQYLRWVENGNIETAYREGNKDGSQIVFVVGVKMRPGEPNQHKIGWFRMMLHPAIMAGGEVDESILTKYKWLTEANLVALTSLIDTTGFTPTTGTGLSQALLETLFPLKAQSSKSPLKGKAVCVKIVSRPNDGPNAPRDRQEGAELFVPAAPVKVEG